MTGPLVKCIVKFTECRIKHACYASRTNNTNLTRNFPLAMQHQSADKLIAIAYITRSVGTMYPLTHYAVYWQLVRFGMLKFLYISFIIIRIVRFRSSAALTIIINGNARSLNEV